MENCKAVGGMHRECRTEATKPVGQRQNFIATEMSYMTFKALPSEALLSRLSFAFLRKRATSITTEAADIKNEISAFRTLENNPLNHNYSHVNQYYTLQKDVVHLYQHGGFPTPFQKQIKTFNEPCIMVRESTVELLDFLKRANYSQPAIRYVLYGETGCGKSLTLAHVLHFGFMNEFILVHVPLVERWTRYYKEVSNSTTRDGYVDLNVDAAAWLGHFKNQNAKLLQKLDLRISKKYEWSMREETEEGSPLIDVVDHGIKRIKYASECVIAVINEIKKHSTEGRCKTLVLIDGFNAFVHPTKCIVTEAKVKVAPSKVSLTEAFMEITKNDWCNGAVVLTVDKVPVIVDKPKSYLPLYLLGKEGFEHLDPFVPVKISEYNENEMESCLQYYINRRWLQNKRGHTEEGKKELKYLSGMNPYHLMKICASL
ncbi:hypothetical protein L9F63_014742 [Diploptera punctata]|uniref:Small ribosomal subunit protein mS29 n=1 Tax=Diploptera punctata TaxID=6984 RepID=A0AAD8A740_DIPPU|nr:hypothetical protein L9F63_014742 [Diploptera punctata]